MLSESSVDLIPFLRNANAAARREAALRGVLVSFAPGQVIWRTGSEARGLFVIVKGTVRAVRSEGGRQEVLHTEHAGATFGEVPLFSGGCYPATTIAAAPTTCIVLDRAAVEAAIAADPSVAFELLARLAGRVRTLVDRVESASHTVPRRLAAYLLARREAAGAAAFTLGAPQAEVAEELGTVREVLVRALRTLVDAGVLAREGRGRVRIADAARLREIASGG